MSLTAMLAFGHLRINKIIIGGQGECENLALGLRTSLSMEKNMANLG